MTRWPRLAGSAAGVVMLPMLDSAFAQQAATPAASTIDWTQIILTLIVAVVGGIPGAITAWRRIDNVTKPVIAHVAEIKDSQAKVVTQVAAIQQATDGMSEKLAKASAAAGHLEGLAEAKKVADIKAEGAAEERQRAADVAAKAREVAAGMPPVPPTTPPKGDPT